MSETITVLRESPPEHSFKLAKTSIEIKSLSELAEAFEVMSDESFSHHVSETKNDFAAWVKDVLHDEELSSRLSSTTDKHQALQILKHKLKESGTSGHYTYISNLFGFGLWDIIIGFVAGLVIGLFLGHFLIPKF